MRTNVNTKQLEKAAKDLRKRESEHIKQVMVAFEKWLEEHRVQDRKERI